MLKEGFQLGRLTRLLRLGIEELIEVEEQRYLEEDLRSLEGSAQEEKRLDGTD